MKSPLRLPVARITCEVHHDAARNALAVLRRLCLPSVLVQAGRSAMLSETTRSPFGAGERLVETPVEVFRFYAPLGTENDLVERIAADAGLDRPGRGSVYAERIQLVGLRETLPMVHADCAGAAETRSVHSLTRLMGISCIVQRGQGSEIARYALELGTGVPVIAFGQGNGLRDRLGLLRITIPAEKDVLNLIVLDHDAPAVMTLMSEQAKLNQPGRGFISMFPVHSGVLNTRIMQGRQRHPASMEQIIAAIDGLRGTTVWRRRFTASDESMQDQKRAGLTRLLDLGLVCPEGQGTRFAIAAMDAGAPGATSTRMRFQSLAATAEGAHPVRALEKVGMVVDAASWDAIGDALGSAGLFDAETAGYVEIGECPGAFVYMRGRAV